MNERIIGFIDGQTVSTIACIDDQCKPYCFNCFYAFDEENALLYFKTSGNTHHSLLMRNNKEVAGTILPDKLNRMAIQGIQFTGVVLDSNDVLNSKAKSIYHIKYPFALAMPGEVWVIQLETIKMTDNTLSFGKKISWSLKEMV